MTLLKNQAIHTALVGNWDNAITLNQKLLKEDPNDIETLNRLAFAYAAIGKTKSAKSTYLKVLKLDSQNPIALRNLRRLQGNANWSDTVMTRTADSMFLEESGKTKVLELINVAEPKVIGHLITGEMVNLRIKRLKIFVLDGKNRFIGMLPDNIGKRLIRFIKGGNDYQAYIKAINNNKVTIFVKETKRATRFKNQPSFISDKSQLLFDKEKFKYKQFASQEEDLEEESL